MNGGNVCFWHLADIPTAPVFVRYWTKADIGRTPKAAGVSSRGVV